MKKFNYRQAQRENSERFKEFTKEKQQVLRIRGYFNRGIARVIESTNILNAYVKELQDPEIRLMNELKAVQEDTYAKITRLTNATTEEEIRKKENRLNGNQISLEIIESKLRHIWISQQAKENDLGYRSEEIAHVIDTIRQISKDICQAETDAHTKVFNIRLAIYGDHPVAKSA